MFNLSNASNASNASNVFDAFGVSDDQRQLNEDIEKSINARKSASQMLEDMFNSEKTATFLAKRFTFVMTNLKLP